MTHARLYILLTIICCWTYAGHSPLYGAEITQNTDAPTDTVTSIMTLREHEVFSHQFTVTNPNERAVRVNRIDTSCTCIEQTLHDYFLLPGQKTFIDVQVNNAFYSGLRHYKLWLYVTDPELEAIEIKSAWVVSPNIAVDLIKADPSQRPSDKRHRDIYRYISNVKPDEGRRLKKHIRLSTPDILAGGLNIQADYTGNIWSFTTKTLDAHSVLLIASARDPKHIMTEGLFEEKITITSNHPHKKTFTLEFFTSVDVNAGNEAQKKSDFNMPPPRMPPPQSLLQR